MVFIIGGFVGDIYGLLVKYCFDFDGLLFINDLWLGIYMIFFDVGVKFVDMDVV